MPDSLPELTPQSRLRLTGGRYEGAGFPVDGLPELIQYERLVMDVAKAVWLRDHPNRKRVPKGFTNVVGLRLIDVERGSTIPVLIRPDTQNTLPDVDPPDILDQAQELVDLAFREIVEYNRLPENFPTGLTGHFLRLGRTLQDNEAIEFGVPKSERVARYTQSLRRRFLTASQDKDFPVDGVLVGQITALDTNDLTLSITDLRGHIIPASYTDDALTPDIKEVFDRYDLAPIVRLDCTQLIASNEDIKKVEDIRSIDVMISTEDIPGRERLLELLRLEKGWLDGEGESIDLQAVERTRDLLEDARKYNLPEPGIFPRTDGSIQIQWITKSDIWTAHLVGEEPIFVDFLAPESDQAGDAIVTSSAEAAAFFAQRFSETNS